MNLKQTSSIIGLFLLAGLLNLHAASASWLGGTSALWSTSANWSGSPATVPGSADTATFNASSANTTVDVGTGLSILNILFDTSGAAAYTIGTGAVGSETFTLANSGKITVNSTVANNQLVNAAITLGADATAQSYSVVNNSSSTLTLAANITGGSTGVGATKTLTFGGSGNIIFGGNLFKGTPTSGTANIAIAKTGSGTFTVNPTSNVGSASGSVIIADGTLAIDFSNAGANNSLLSSSSPLTLSGGTLKINGNPSSANTQIFSSTAFTNGGNVINMVNNGTSPTLALGGLTWAGYASVQYLTSGTSTITTTTHGAGPGNILWNDYDVYGTSDWAVSTNAGSPYNIAGLSSWTGYVTTMGGTGQGINVDLTANYTTTSGNNGATTVRFNTPTATSINVNGHWQVNNAVLVTPNMGANNCAVGNGNWYAVYNTSAGTEWIWQNNPSGYFGIGSLINNKGGTGALTYVQAGPGTVVMPGTSTTSGAATLSANQFTGQTYLNGGQTVVGVDADLGAPATGAQVNLNGGTIVAGTITGSSGYPATVSGGANVTLDNAGSNKRTIILGSAGGGLAATAGSTLTVDGQIGSATGTGPLVIGIPASAANGSVAGLLPGTGSGTANTTPVYCTGTVALTYPNAGNGNYQYGGTLITGGATLAINSQYALGGADQGPTIFNGGTLQYTATLATSPAGTALDISGQSVTFTGNATIDVNSHAVTYANAIGNGGSGALTVASTSPNGILTLTGANNYSGGTTISSGTLRVNNTTGSGTGSGNVNIASGGTLAGIGTISGAVTNLSGGHLAPGNGGLGTNTVGALTMNSGSFYDFEFSGTANDQTVVSTSGGLTINGGAFNLYQPGGVLAYTTTGTYNLIQYSGAIGGTGLDSTWTTASAGNPHIANPQAGLAYAFGTSSGYLTLTISVAGVVASWTNNVDGNWTDGTKWSSNPSVPHSAGDAATFGVGSALRTVTLNVNETVGGLFFTNANSFVIANAGNTLTLDNSGGGVNLNVTAGVTNVIQTSVSLNDNATVTVNSGDSLAISGIISNAPGVTKTLTINGAGTNILSAANTYGPTAGSVGTTLSGGGVLQVANNSALGAGDLSITANSTLQAGASSLTIGNNLAVGTGVTATVDNNGNALSLGGVISGSGALTKVGSGTLALGGMNSYTGNTTVNAGGLSLSSAANVASSPNIILNGGDLLGNGSFTLPNNIGIGLATGSGSTTALIDAAGTFTVNGVIASAGNFGVNSLTVNSQGGTGTLILAATNTFNGVTSLSNGVLQIASTLALQNSTLEYDAGTLLFDPSITATTFGGLNGTNAIGIGLTNLSGAALTLTVGNNNSSTTFGGVLSGVGSLVKVGTGTQTIGTGTSGGADYSGLTKVNSGTLKLGGVGSLTSAGNLTISGTGGPANLILADSASVSVAGMVQVLYDGGVGYPGACSLLITNNASLTGASLSFGDGSRVASSSVTVQGNGLLSITNAFDLNDTIGSSPQTDLANVNGGTLAVGNFLDTYAAATHQAQINFNGGVLQANASDPTSGPTSTFLPAFSGLTVYVNAGAGARINPNGYNITIAAPIVHGNGTPDGGLTVLGTGTLTLNGANTYTGNTTITNGTLALGASGSIATSTNIIIGGSATFDVSALGGGFVLGSSQTLSNSTSTATLSGNINTGSGTFALTYASGTPSFSVTNGTLTVPSTTTFNVNNTGTALAVGSYKLISTNLDGSGFVSPGTLPTVTVGGNGVAGGAGTPALQVNNSELYLVVPSGVNTNPTNLTATVTGSTLSLTWPPDHLGWTLQTNAADLANTNDWFAYPGSSSVTNVVITIDPSQTNVFFRMVYP